MAVQVFDKYDHDDAYHWDKVFTPWWRRDVRLMALYQVALDLAGRNIALAGAFGLDVGCGDGVLLALARKRGATLVGLDGARRGLTLARQRCESRGLCPKLVEGDAERLPFPHHTFDFITCLEVIEHLQRPKFLMSELRRVLRPGGVAVLSTPLKRSDGMLHDRFHVREFDASELATTLSLNFGDVRVVGLHHHLLDRLYVKGVGGKGVNRLVRGGFKLLTTLRANPYRLTASNRRSVQHATLLGCCR